jgi:hypothetical protein
MPVRKEHWYTDSQRGQQAVSDFCLFLVLHCRTVIFESKFTRSKNREKLNIGRCYRGGSVEPGLTVDPAVKVQSAPVYTVFRFFPPDFLA